MSDNCPQCGRDHAWCDPTDPCAESDSRSWKLGPAGYPFAAAILRGPTLTEDVEVVPRSDAEALAEALESIAARHLPPQISREIARDAIDAYRARHPKETP